MDLSFQEKSAWGVLAGLLLVSAFYFPAALDIVNYSGNPIALIVISIVGIVALVVIEIVYHLFVALSGDSESDERDAIIDLRAERNGGFALGFALVTLNMYIVAESIKAGGVAPNGLLIVVYIIAALNFSEVAKLVSQIWYYRVGRL